MSGEQMDATRVALSQQTEGIDVLCLSASD
jgi:hypothetical protein